MSDNNQNQQCILADGHVHIYECFDESKLLDSASKNFLARAKRQKCQNNYASVLFFSESSQDNRFYQFLEQCQAGKSSLKNWNFRCTGEKVSLYAYNQRGESLFLIAGHQIVTVEKLEVLALITTEKVTDGLTLTETIKAIIDNGGIPVLPWGFGKWVGARGKLISQLIGNHNFPYLFLGDNGGRPRFWRTPTYFQLAQKKGLKILPGTDPLPIASQFYRPGSFGFSIPGRLDLENPGKHLKELLLNPEIDLQSYGSLESPWKFFQNQLAMRM